MGVLDLSIPNFRTPTSCLNSHRTMPKRGNIAHFHRHSEAPSSKYSSHHHASGVSASSARVTIEGGLPESCLENKHVCPHHHRRPYANIIGPHCLVPFPSCLGGDLSVYTLRLICCQVGLNTCCRRRSAFLSFSHLVPDLSFVVQVRPRVTPLLTVRHAAVFTAAMRHSSQSRVSKTNGFCG
jgi:hypothetical protein